MPSILAVVSLKLTPRHLLRMKPVRKCKNAAEEGLPMYAECGGLMYLAEVALGGKDLSYGRYFPGRHRREQKTAGTWICNCEVAHPNPYFDREMSCTAMNFTIPMCLNYRKKTGFLCLQDAKGYGIMNKMDGFCYKNVLATYTHLHALGAKEWVDGMMRIAHSYQRKKLILK